HKVKYWEKVWLAQRTGKDMEKYAVHFKLLLSSLNQQEIEELRIRIEDKGEVLWLMQDKHATNDEVSTFDNQHIKYYPGDINWQELTAYFKDVYFDSDKSVYDQYTFGVGPQMIVQAQVEGCDKKRLTATLEITGGKAPY